MNLCYLDANATTFMPDVVVKSMMKWINKGNPSASYETAEECKNLMNTFKNAIINDNNLHNFTVLFTSGASESNAHILISSVRSFMTRTGKLPHIIISAVEHKSILSCCEDLKQDGLCQYTKINVQKNGPGYGTINPDDLDAAIKPNTCLISIMTANNETGIINNIPALAAVAHKYNIPFHTDCVQSFGKDGVYPGVDACSVSFHKLSGPTGLGLLIIRNSFLEGYRLRPLISGTQNGGLRGGTENIPAIAASYAAYRYNQLRRTEKNERLLTLKLFLMGLINKYIPCYFIDEYNEQYQSKNKIFWISNRNNEKMLPNTILLTVYKNDFCNMKVKKALEDHNIIVSIGSACNTAIHRPSDVISNLGIPDVLRSGILRISLPDDITKEQIIYFVTVFLKLI